MVVLIRPTCFISLSARINKDMKVYKEHKRIVSLNQLCHYSLSVIIPSLLPLPKVQVFLVWNDVQSTCQFIISTGMHQVSRWSSTCLDLNFLDDKKTLAVKTPSTKTWVGKHCTDAHAQMSVDLSLYPHPAHTGHPYTSHLCGNTQFASSLDQRRSWTMVQVHLCPPIRHWQVPTGTLSISNSTSPLEFISYMALQGARLDDGWGGGELQNSFCLQLWGEIQTAEKWHCLPGLGRQIIPLDHAAGLRLCESMQPPFSQVPTISPSSFQ